MMHHRQSGMSLVEVLVACVILAVLGVGVMLFLQRDTKLQSRLRVHAWSDVAFNSATAMAQSGAATLDASHRTSSGYLQEGPSDWHYVLTWLGEGLVSDHVRVNICEQRSDLCWSRDVERWRYASEKK